MQLFTLCLLLLAFRVNSTLSNNDKLSGSVEDKIFIEIYSGSGEEPDPVVVVGGSGDITMPTNKINSGSGFSPDPVVVVGGSGDITMPTNKINSGSGFSPDPVVNDVGSGDITTPTNKINSGSGFSPDPVVNEGGAGDITMPTHEIYNPKEINNPIVNPTTVPNVNKPPVIDAELLSGMTKGCLPSIAKIHRYTGEIVPITELKMWDPVMINSEYASLVFHLMRIFGSPTDTDNAFLKFTTAEGVIHVSASTMLYVNDDIAAAYNVKKNDFLIRENGTATPVLKIEEVYLPGLFSPYTMHGDIVIDGFRLLTKVSEKQIKKRSLLTPVHDILKFLVSKRDLENVPTNTLLQ